MDIVVWPVRHENLGTLNRSVALWRELSLLGFRPKKVFNHSLRHMVTTRNRGNLGDWHFDEEEVWGPMLPLRAPKAKGSDRIAVTSPLSGAAWVRCAEWIDFFDDWTIAPETPPHARILAYRSYQAAMKADAVVTVNSPYMRAKLGTGTVVPNGVEDRFLDIACTGDGRPRLIVLGTLRHGRTDFSLIRRVAAMPMFDEVLVGGRGTRWLASALSRERDGIVYRDNYSWAEIAAICGPRTVALIPSAVNDYTISQDPMKLYQFLALGIRVLIPRTLWPSHLPLQQGYLIERGVGIDDLAEAAVEAPAVSESWRTRFVDSNSWKARATVVARLLADR